jgi:arylsulfate sulfotransferase
MNTRSIVLLFILSIQLSSFLLCSPKHNAEILYLSPVPGSKFITKETDVIIRFKSDINRMSLNTDKFSITGSLSGLHKYEIIQTDERNTVILKPEIYFTPGENIIVKINEGLSSVNGNRFSPYEFMFTVSSYSSNTKRFNKTPYSDEYLRTHQGIPDVQNYTFVIQPDWVPSDFPEITIISKDNPSQSYIFLCNFLRFSPGPNQPFLMVLDNRGYPLLYKRMGESCLDFKVQNNNIFTYFRGGNIEKFYSAKPNLEVTDSFYCGNGYSTDPHELLLLPDNKAYLMSYDSQRVDMSQIIQGGNPNAIVVGLIIQEIDENKNVIFQWRSWDHFQITDATHEDLLAANIDYVHGNAIELDFDGNVLISSRHLDEITKINRQTGTIIWRLGGKHNQFTFTNETIGFSHQHNIRRLANGNYTLFDNGNFHTPPFSRAVEYKLDQVHKTATLIWQYRSSPDIYAFAMGNAQRLENGNTVIGWGSANPTMTEVRPNGTKAFEMTLAPTVVSYRAFRFTWEGSPPQIPANYTLGQNYPNPFNPTTTIRYGLPENAFVTIKVYDILGREVKTLVSEQQEAGNYIVEFNAQGFSSGVYFYKINTNGYHESKKLVFVK